MDTDHFWGVIEAAQVSARASKPFHEVLTDLLAARTQQEILDYQDKFDEAHLALYRWDMWAAAYLIGGGCSDDSFMDFRAGLIAQGRDWYQKAADSPDNLAGHPAVTAAVRRRWENPLFYEEVNYAASYAFERVSGDDHAPGTRSKHARNETVRPRTWARTSTLTMSRRCTAGFPGSLPSTSAIQRPYAEPVLLCRHTAVVPFAGQVRGHPPKPLWPCPP